MIKVVNLVALIIAPIVVVYQDLKIGGWIVVLLLVAVLVWAVRQSKRPAPKLADTETSVSSGD